MRTPKLVLQFEGLPAEGGHIRLSSFVKTLELIYIATGRFDKAMSNTGSPTFYYRIVELKMHSPATVTVEPHQIDPMRPMNTIAISKAIALWKNVERGQFQEPVELPYLEDAQRLAQYVQRGMKSVNISYNGEAYEITPDFKAKIDLALTPEEYYLGAVRGTLEFLNIHGQKKVFRIYSQIEPKVLKCYFPDELMNKAISAINRRVEITGVLSYRAKAKFPDEVEVKEIEIFPLDEELPTIDDLRGICPGLTRGIPSEDFVKELPNARQN